MHASALEIAWHDSASIWSVDISRGNRLLTAGGDKVARVWRLSETPFQTLRRVIDSTTPKAVVQSQASLAEWLCDLRAHATTVNVARFSRDGFTIATGADGGEIVIWTLEHGQPLKSISDGDAPLPKEKWVRLATLRGHVQDVLDLTWSNDASRLVSASIDNAIKVWDVKNPTKPPFTIRSHTNFVQGVSIDPFSRLIASLGNDRALRIFTTSASNSWYQVASVSSHMDINDSRLFIDDARFKNCFRRLAWSPDGSVVACPSAMHFPHAKRLFAVYLFSRNIWHRPAAQCGGLVKPACAVRFSPVLYELRGVKEKLHGVDVAPAKTGKGPFALFKYRMIFAVLCVDSVLFYDTESLARPFAMVEGLHCAEHTDISWSSDGLTAAISSVDGYVSFVCFKTEELGMPLAQENTPPWLNRREELEQSFAARSPRKSKMAVTVVRPKSVNDTTIGTNPPKLSFPPPPVTPTKAGNENTGQSPSLPGSPSLAHDGSAKAMVSPSSFDPQPAHVTKTANGGQRISVAKPANHESLSTPCQSDLMDAGAEVAANAMREAMSEMLMTENSQSPLPASKRPGASGATRFEHDESDITDGEYTAPDPRSAPTESTRTNAKSYEQAKHASSKEAPASEGQRSDVTIAVRSSPAVTSSPGRVVSVDPASPLRSCPTLEPKSSKPVPPTPSLSKRLGDIFAATDSTPEAVSKLPPSKTRLKSGKVQTTLFSFTGLSKRPSDKPAQRQNVPEARKVTPDVPLQKNSASAPERKLAVRSPEEEEGGGKKTTVKRIAEQEASSDDLKRRKLMEKPGPHSSN